MQILKRGQMIDFMGKRQLAVMISAVFMIGFCKVKFFIFWPPVWEITPVRC